MKGSRLHLDLFKVFQDLAQSRSFSKTAGRNFLTQSAVSQQLSFLERHLGKKLIDRGRNRFSLTEPGKALWEGSREILNAYEEMVDRIKGPREVSGVVNVETIYSIGLYELSSHVKSFMQRYPKVRLDLQYSRSDRIYADVLQGACDLGIVAYPRDHPLIRVLPFKREKLAVVCSPEDPLAAKKRVRIGDLQGKNFLTFHRDIPTRKAVDGILRKAGVTVHIVHEFDNIETVKRAVEIGAGVSILPEVTVESEKGSGTLACLPFQGMSLDRPTGILCSRGKSGSRAAREFIRWLSRPPEKTRPPREHPGPPQHQG